jgi:hypothetical protein
MESARRFWRALSPIWLFHEMTLPPRAAVGDDLALLELPSLSEANQGFCSYRVLTPVLSDLDVYPGQILTMRLLGESEEPEAFAIVAVSAGDRLLLRQFVQPAQLITNSRKATAPCLWLGEEVKILACLW